MWETLTPWLQFGEGGVFLALLFLGLRSGAIYTRSAVTLIIDGYEKRIADKDKYIEKLEQITAKQDERNDLLTSRIGHALELARSSGMIEALPPQTAERILK